MPTYTPNLKLPQWTANEHPGYMSDFNQAFLSIDNGFGGVNQNVTAAVTTAQRAETIAEQAEEIGQQNSTRIVALENTLDVPTPIALTPINVNDKVQSVSASGRSIGGIISLSVILTPKVGETFSPGDLLFNANIPGYSILSNAFLASTEHYVENNVSYPAAISLHTDSGFYVASSQKDAHISDIFAATGRGLRFNAFLITRASNTRSLGNEREILGNM